MDKSKFADVPHCLFAPVFDVEQNRAGYSCYDKAAVPT